MLMYVNLSTYITGGGHPYCGTSS